MPGRDSPDDRRWSNATYGAAWRKARRRALERAGHLCQHCGSRRELQVDHLTPPFRLCARSVQGVKAAAWPSRRGEGLLTEAAVRAAITADRLQRRTAELADWLDRWQS